MQPKHSRNKFNETAAAGQQMGRQLIEELGKHCPNEDKTTALVRAGANLSVTDEDGNDALSLSACNGFDRTLDAILKRQDADCNHPNRYKMTALMWASAAGKMPAADKLTHDPRVNLDLKDWKQRSAEDCAGDFEHHHIGRMIAKERQRRAEMPRRHEKRKVPNA